jgi:hypothetical protein
LEILQPEIRLEEKGRWEMSLARQDRRDDGTPEQRVSHGEAVNEQRVAAFVALLDRCKAQVEADPSSVVNNGHLYDLLHHVYLRLCHGNIPDAAVQRRG